MEPRFTVSRFNEMINSTLEAIGDVIVEGEITQLNISSKGGLNFVIKDPSNPAILNVSGYAPRVEGINLVKEGMKVAAYGIPNLWSIGGRFSLSIYKVIPLGEGALKEAYLNLKKQLDKEGLFSLDRKRPLPDLITKIALITGDKSAAESDFLKIIKENKVGIEIYNYSVQVQGKYSEIEILNALNHSDKQGLDVIALVRGGGSLEDLITFNSEKVARKIFSMNTPVIVGVGHEKDESIADFVADIRASTPSQAAYYIAINNSNYINSQKQKSEYILNALNRRIDRFNIEISSKTKNILNRINIILERIGNKKERLVFNINNFKNYFINISKDILNYTRLLNSFNPKSILKKGYSIVKKNGLIVKNINQINIKDKLEIEIFKGIIKSEVLEINNKDK